ncbi:MAG TPA: SpoIIE family protein phosphatase [Thermoanaerobaculia bacterium]
MEKLHNPPAIANPETVASLLTVIQELGSAPDLRAGLARVAELLRSQVPYDNLSVLLLDDLGRELRFELAVGYPVEVAEHWRFGMGQGIVGTAARTREVIWSPDVCEDRRYLRATDEVRSELAIPLLAKGRTIGVLDVGSQSPHAFSEEQRAFLTSLAGFLANAIENVQLYQNLREQARTLSLLHEVSREVSSILDRRRLLEKVAELLKRLIDYDLFSVLIWCEDRQLLDPWVAFDRQGLEFGGISPIGLGQGVCGTAAALRQSVRVPNVHLDPRYLKCMSGLEASSELVVPMIFKDRLIGVLDLESKEYDAFTAQHEQLLSTLAASLAIALENARLYERLLEDEKRIRDDLETARQIQANLMPKASPWIPGLQVGFAYEPARHLGGDFYDFLSYGEGRLGIAVGDVAGKATAAALYGSFAIGMLREHAAHGTYSPSQILTDMSCRLRHLKIDRRFLAMVFAVYDGASRTLSMASSGLPYPYHLSGGEVREVQIKGVPLGLMTGTTYEEALLVLAPGDAVVICSDGVEECRNADDEAFGGEQVRQILARLANAPAAEIAQGLLQAIQRHAGMAEPSDDRTVVVLKVAG